MNKQVKSSRSVKQAALATIVAASLVGAGAIAPHQDWAMNLLAASNADDTPALDSFDTANTLVYQMVSPAYDPYKSNGSSYGAIDFLGQLSYDSSSKLFDGMNFRIRMFPNGADDKAVYSHIVVRGSKYASQMDVKDTYLRVYRDKNLRDTPVVIASPAGGELQEKWSTSGPYAGFNPSWEQGKLFFTSLNEIKSRWLGLNWVDRANSKSAWVNVTALEFTGLFKEFTADNDFLMSITQPKDDAKMKSCFWITSGNNNDPDCAGYTQNQEINIIQKVQGTTVAGVKMINSKLPANAKVPAEVTSNTLGAANVVTKLSDGVNLLNNYLYFSRAAAGERPSDTIPAASSQFRQALKDYFNPAKFQYRTPRGGMLSAQQYADAAAKLDAASDAQQLYLAYNEIINGPTMTAVPTSTTPVTPTTSEQSNPGSETNPSGGSEPATPDDSDARSVKTVNELLERLKQLHDEAVDDKNTWEQESMILSAMQPLTEDVFKEARSTLDDRAKALEFMVDGYGDILERDASQYRQDVLNGKANSTALSAGYLAHLDSLRGYVNRLSAVSVSEDANINAAYDDVKTSMQRLLDFTVAQDNLSQARTLVNDADTILTNFGKFTYQNASHRADAQAMTALILEKRKGIASIAIMQSQLWLPDQNSVLSKINDASSQTQIDMIVDDALSPDNLERSQANRVVSQLGYLTQGDRDAYLEKLAKAQSKEEIDQIIKEAAKQSINLSPIDELAKNQARAGIDYATNVSEVSIAMPRDNWNAPAAETSTPETPLITRITGTPESTTSKQSIPPGEPQTETSEPSSAPPASGSSDGSIIRWIFVVLSVLGAAGIGFAATQQ